ncbi:MAG: hypothetical protein KAI81_01555, partial [Candidatus Marinimicrobia bacterium]|nr:hypothetical protein [Candidatus Neomarinimicrobiota bacterium]
YYPEKRQFFLKGQSYYNFNLGSARLFYSRKVGIEDNNIVPILGGVRLFGKLGRSNIGIMSMQTDEKDNIPGSNLSIIRLKQDIFKQSSMGILATQKYSDKGYNRVYGTDFSYSTSNVFKDKNLILNGHIALSETTNFDDSDMNSNTMAYDVSLSYPNDLIEYDLGYRSIEKGFNPEMGFVNRDNYDVLYTELQFNPRFKNMPVFRNLIFKPIDIDYYINHESKKTESISYEWRPLGFVTKSGEFLEFNVQHEFDRPEEDFTLIDTVKVSAGEYWDSHFEILGATFSGRKISSFFIINIGEFYTGNRQEYFLATSFNINKHLNIILDIERNYIQLPQATFVTSEIGGRIDYAFTPKLQSGLFAQWNNDADQIFLNYRINWIPKTGSYFYFVINQEYNTSDQLKLMRTTIIGKLIWRFAL